MRLVVQDERKQFNQQTRAYAEYRAFASLAGADPPVDDVTVTLTRSSRDESDCEGERIVCTIAIRTGSGEIAEARAVAGHAYAAIDTAASFVGAACRREHQSADGDSVVLSEETVIVNGSLKTLNRRDIHGLRSALNEVREPFDRAARTLGLDRGTTQLRRSPMRDHRVIVPANYCWEREDVLQKLDARMTAAFAEVHERAERGQVSLRDAAYLLAVERVARACRERGWV